METHWKNYEEVARHLLDRFAHEFGLVKVEGKQVIKGRRSGTKWEIDAKGVREGNESFVIVECRRYTKSKQDQEKLGSLAYRILDTGAHGGIIVSPLGIQEGAAIIAAAENILNVRLNAKSTPHDFCMQFLNKMMLGLSETMTVSETVTVTISQACQSCGKEFIVRENEQNCPKCRNK
jgi:hypothetical protein